MENRIHQPLKLIIIKKVDKKTNLQKHSKLIPFEIPHSLEWARLFSTADIFTGNSINKTEKETKYLNLSEGYNIYCNKRY